MEKPEKYTWCELLSVPVRKLREVIKGFIDTIKISCLGYWYCNGCKEYHSPRVKKFYKNISVMCIAVKKQVCSLHKDKEITN